MDKIPSKRSQLDQSSVPLYLQIATLIRRRITSGQWAEGYQIPTLEDLMAEFGVGRVTVRQALDIIERDGLVRRQRGRGTFVSKTGADRHWLTLTSNWATLKQATEGTVTKTLVDRPADTPPPLAEDEGIVASAYRYLRRIHTLDGRPYALLDIYLDADLYARAPTEAFEKTTVLRLLGTLPGVAVGKAWQTLTIETADTETASLLSVQVNDPVAEVRRIVHDALGRVIYFCHLTYRGDFIRFRIDLKD